MGIKESRSNPIPDDLTIRKAEFFSNGQGCKNFRLSKGTICRLKERKGLSLYSVRERWLGLNWKNASN